MSCLSYLLDIQTSDGSSANVEYDAKWSCENTDFKKEWLKLCMASPKVFEDICDLHNPTVQEYVSGTRLEVDDIFELWIGSAANMCRWRTLSGKVLPA